MRYAVLAAVYSGCKGKPGCTIPVASFAEELGIWREDLFRALEFLDRKGYLSYQGAGPLVSITQKGIDYIERSSERRKSVRN